MKPKRRLFAIAIVMAGCLSMTSCEEILYGLMMGMASAPYYYPTTPSPSVSSIPPPPMPTYTPLPSPTYTSPYTPTFTPDFSATPSYATPSYSTSESGGSSGSGSGSSNPVQPHQVTESCSLCHGSGKCASCNGTHRINYQFGSGTLECPNCKPNGACSSCGGSGKKTSTKYY